ncbi:MAG TPA: heterodisulfide reductase-related iron-sulfur binding cluster [Ktedonobacterales bacterium]|nr:heterodisulfide reductase-related iron-sulfur binding cluster [Ktedonobacterales bacterium]
MAERTIHTTAAAMISAFDAHRPPEREIIEDCVHCGFCLPTCPTWLLWGEEMDSPRGRINLMKLATDGEIGLSPQVRGHFDACLGCMACVTACPSGVRYDQLIEATRPQLERNTPRPLGDRIYRALIFSLFPHPRRMRFMLPLLWLYQKSGARRVVRSRWLQQRLPARLLAMEAVLPPVRLRRRGALSFALTTETPDAAPRTRVGVLLGCVQRVFFDEVNAATVRVLAAEGYEVVPVASQGCCGALSIHAGREHEGLRYARRLIDAFEAARLDAIAVNVAGCGSVLKEYGHLLRDDPAYAGRAAAFSAKVRDISELLASQPPRAPRHPIAARVAYHDACHLRHGQGITRQPRELLRQIPGLDIAEPAEADICCGSAGVYNLLAPEPAAQLGQRKAANILATRPDALVAANPGCLLQIGSSLAQEGHPLPAFHPIQLLDASIRGVPLAGLPITSSHGE